MRHHHSLRGRNSGQLRNRSIGTRFWAAVGVLLAVLRRRGHSFTPHGGLPGIGRAAARHRTGSRTAYSHGETEVTGLADTDPGARAAHRPCRPVEAAQATGFLRRHHQGRGLRCLIGSVARRPYGTRLRFIRHPVFPLFTNHAILLSSHSVYGITCHYGDTS